MPSPGPSSILEPRVRPALPALEIHWTRPGGIRPLSIREARPFGNPRDMRAVPPAFTPALLHLEGSCTGAFDFARNMQSLCADVVSRCSHLHHIAMERVLVGITLARTNRRHGLQAKVTPMRFQDGRLTRRRRGRTYQVQRYWYEGVEILYVMTFCLPRFLNQSFDEKLVTIFHELFHIAPEFNGDLRRHDGRYCIHTRSQREYDRQMAAHAREYLCGGAPPHLHAFLRLTFQELRARYGRVLGQTIPVPKLVPIH